MRKRGEFAIAIAIAAVTLVVGPSWAQPPDPPTEDESQIERPRPMPRIPAEFRRIVSAVSPQRLNVRYLNGETHPIDLPWHEPAGYRLFQNGRYLGIRLQGNEDYGYVLVDRAGPGGNHFETGGVPVFSADGRYFAAAEISESGWSNLEGIAVWEMRPNETIRRLFIDALPAGQHWRADRWVRPDCVALSAVAGDWQPPVGEEWATALRNAPRGHYGVEIGETIVFHATFDQPACVENAETAR